MTRRGAGWPLVHPICAEGGAAGPDCGPSVTDDFSLVAIRAPLRCGCRRLGLSKMGDALRGVEEVSVPATSEISCRHGRCGAAAAGGTWFERQTAQNHCPRRTGEARGAGVLGRLRIAFGISCRSAPPWRSLRLCREPKVSKGPGAIQDAGFAALTATDSFNIKNISGSLFEDETITTRYAFV